MINKTIKTWNDGTKIGYGKGRFDDYCVYMEENGIIRAPRDVEYFAQIKKLAEKYSTVTVYNHMRTIFNIARKKQINSAAFTQLDNLSDLYKSEDKLQVNKLYFIIFLAMLAEENKAYTKLGARIKLLGLYELLIGGRDAIDAANFMRGMSWVSIANLALARGF